MNRPKVHEGPQQSRRIRYEKVGVEWVKAGVFFALALAFGAVPWIIGVVVGLKALGALAGLW